MSDPIFDIPDHQKVLFKRFSEAASGFASSDVVGAAINLLINGIRQSAADWTTAEKQFDDYLGKSKQILKDHYDSHGRKRGIFPYDQTLNIEQMHVDVEGFRNI